MDILAFIQALKAKGQTAEQIMAAVDQYLEDNPEALDQDAVEAILDGRLDDIVLVQASQPTAEDNRIWFPTGAGETVQVPTYEEHNELKSAVNDTDDKLDAIADATTDKTETVTRTDFSPAWELGVCLLDGTPQASTSYAYTTTTEIPVQAGDKITCGDSRDISKASMRYVTCYNGNTVRSDKGEENTTEFTVPYGVTRVVITAGSSAMANSYYIKRYRTTATYAIKDNLAKYEAEEMHGWED